MKSTITPHVGPVEDRLVNQRGIVTQDAASSDLVDIARRCLVQVRPGILRQLVDGYFGLVTYFNMRDLTFPDDIERACAGIAAVFSRNLDSPVVHNIPAVLLPYALLWHPAQKGLYAPRSQSGCFPT